MSSNRILAGALETVVSPFTASDDYRAESTFPVARRRDFCSQPPSATQIFCYLARGQLYLRLVVMAKILMMFGRKVCGFDLSYISPAKRDTCISSTKGVSFDSSTSRTQKTYRKNRSM